VSRHAYGIYKRQGSRDLKDRAEGRSKEFSSDHPKASGIGMERPSSLYLYDGKKRDKIYQIACISAKGAEGVAIKFKDASLEK
jgi:hypothetical protein